MNKNILLINCILAALTVVIGAFGAHALKPILEANGKITSFETAVKYQFYHILAVFIVCIIGIINPKISVLNIVILFWIGILLFSGSIYVLSLTNGKWAGPITPVGGLFFIAGWITFAYQIYKNG
jgi:uncharacterized membrane protein YgdD (TMEM256/DUF423 family)